MAAFSGWAPGSGRASVGQTMPSSASPEGPHLRPLARLERTSTCHAPTAAFRRGCVKTARNDRLPFCCAGWTGMKRFVEGVDRRQTTLLPDCVDDYVAEENPVRAIDAFVDALELSVLGFEGAVPEATG